MASKNTYQLVRALGQMSEMHPSKLTRGNVRPAIRNLASCSACAARQSTLSKVSISPALSPAFTIPNRSFLNLVAPISARRMEFSECRTLRYTPEQMYNVVANVDQYQHFVPWCRKSQIMKGRNGNVRAALEIGFSPIVERYISEVTTVPNHQVRAVCTDGSLFSHLETIWRFGPGAKDQPDSCEVDFHVQFEFKNPLHSHLATMFFDEVIKQMVAAFESRAAKIYGTRPRSSSQRTRPRSSSQRTGEEPVRSHR